MGNKLGRRHAVDEKFTRPQGLYQHKDVDHKKLRKLILDSKLAPCYPGEDDNASDLEECPICFLYYPSLNRSRCCMKGICTECFLQMKTPNSNRPTQCPFCKTSNYAVEYRGVKTKEEKGLEQLEEQRVIEAKIRMRQKEIVDDEERILKQREMSSSSRRGPAEVEYTSIAAPSVSSPVDEIVDAHEWDTAGSIRPLPWQRQNRENDFDIDLEDIMVMEAVWLSIQESGRHRDPASCDAAHSEEDVADDGRSTTVMTPASGPSSSSPSSGLACAIAALAERQQMNGETSIKYTGDVSSYSTPCCSQYRQGQEPADYFQADGAVTTSNDPGQWMDRRSEVTELGTSYGGYDESEDATSQAEPPHQGNEGQSGLQAQQIESAIVPESFEEQMMLAMAVSLAEARTRSSTPGIAWH